jgi:pyruvate dehydrogenase complex dehydrogenase (E1) component
MSGSTDLETSETNEWLDSLRAVLHHQGPARAAYLLAADRRSVSTNPHVNLSAGVRAHVRARV